MWYQEKMVKSHVAGTLGEALRCSVDSSMASIPNRHGLMACGMTTQQWRTVSPISYATGDVVPLYLRIHSLVSM
jgi:hypothetical protein